MSPNDGGPAFPGSSLHSDARNPGWIGGGMSLRDYFAAAALTGLLQRGTITDMPLLAEKAWLAADWMLHERPRVKP